MNTNPKDFAYECPYDELADMWETYRGAFMSEAAEALFNAAVLRNRHWVWVKDSFLFEQAMSLACGEEL